MRPIINFLNIVSFVAVLSGCGGGDDKETTEEEQQLVSLSGTWTIVSATKDIDRTSDFKDPDLTLEISGTYDANNPKGPYNYTITGALPESAPWASGSGTWTFGADPSTTIIRDDDVEIAYVLSGNTLTLTFTCMTCDEDNGREKSAEGEWIFVFEAQ